ncbi:MAG TPA: alpha/beta fold hydrolase, partial [Fimbriimonas sp.]|nr:alpha/beta fold hydrolase [Fimbriimonas sp.]
MIDDGFFQENERTAPVSNEKQFLSVGDVDCECGVTLPDVTVAYETFGNRRGLPILVCHALTGDSHAIGWWERLIGPGKAIDTDKYLVVCSNSLGGCQGTTGPTSPAPDGKPYGARFPMISVGDMIEVQARLADHLGISQWWCVAGGSMGGMQALEWTTRFPNRVRKAFITASCMAHSPMQIAINEVARQAIRRDANFDGGNYYDHEPPLMGLSVARMLGHISFLSDAAFEAKFSRRLQGKDKFDNH